jgi:accessory gene regulator protein AgrB
MDEIKEVNEIEIEKPKTKSMVIQIIFLVLLLISISALIYAGITVVRYHEMLLNPLGYNLAKFNIESCSCVSNLGDRFFVTPINLTT